MLSNQIKVISLKFHGTLGRAFGDLLDGKKKSYSECSMKICKDEDESLASFRAGAQGGVGGQAGRQPSVRLWRTEPFAFCPYCIRFLESM